LLLRDKELTLRRTTLHFRLSRSSDERAALLRRSREGADVLSLRQALVKQAFVKQAFVKQTGEADW
jgi:hypothetical protein